MPVSRERAMWIRRGIPAAAAAGIVAAAFWPTSRWTGTNYVVSKSTLPLWKKASEFIERDDHLQTTAELALGHVSGAEAKSLAAMTWTRANIRYAPPDRPVIDDHIWNVIVRGYGQADQLADVFTTLLTYDGVPAFWQVVGRSPNVIPVSYVWIGGQWRAFDVSRGLIFRTPSGALATPADIAADHDIIRRAAAAAAIDDLDDYLAHFQSYRPPTQPDILRAELQMPRRRLTFELCHAAGLGCGTTRFDSTQSEIHNR